MKMEMDGIIITRGARFKMQTEGKRDQLVDFFFVSRPFYLKFGSA